MYRMPPSSNESHMDSHFNESFDVSKSLDGSVRISEQENPALEPKKQKDFDNWKNVDKEAKDKKKQRDAGIEGDRPEKGITMCGKESDDGCADGEIAIERERGVFNFGVQQRKRMLRPRDSPQVANCEPRFMSHAQDSEGCQGKSEVSSVIYKVSECMQELIKLWKEYETSQSDKNSESSHKGPTLEIRIPEHITATNRQVRGGQLWETYIQMTLILSLFSCIQPTSVPLLLLHLPSKSYVLLSECCLHEIKGGGTIDLEPCFPHTSAVEPTLAPVAVNRTMTTRALASV